MRRFVIAAIMMVLLPASAYPQQGQDRGPPTARTESEKKKDAAIDQAYQDALKRTGGSKQSATVDPWQTLRPADDSAKR